MAADDSSHIRLFYKSVTIAFKDQHFRTIHYVVFVFPCHHVGLTDEFKCKKVEWPILDQKCITGFKIYCVDSHMDRWIHGHGDAIKPIFPYTKKE